MERKALGIAVRKILAFGGGHKTSPFPHGFLGYPAPVPRFAYRRKALAELDPRSTSGAVLAREPAPHVDFMVKK